MPPINFFCLIVPLRAMRRLQSFLKVSAKSMTTPTQCQCGQPLSGHSNFENIQLNCFTFFPFFLFVEKQILKLKDPNFSNIKRMRGCLNLAAAVWHIPLWDMTTCGFFVLKIWGWSKLPFVRLNSTTSMYLHTYTYIIQTQVYSSVRSNTLNVVNKMVFCTLTQGTWNNEEKL